MSDQERGSAEDWTPSPAHEDRLFALRVNAQAGTAARSLYDFVNGPTPPAAIPVLISFLNEVSHPALREALVRAVAVREARGTANAAVLSQLHETDDDHLRFVCANTMSVIAKPEDLDELLVALERSASSATRAMLLRAIAKTKDRRAVPRLVPYLASEELAPEVAASIYSLDASRGPELVVVLNGLIEGRRGSWKRAEQVRRRMVRGR